MAGIGFTVEKAMHPRIGGAIPEFGGLSLRDNPLRRQSTIMTRSAMA
jgi:hypothetical protein